jgi:predicted AlkP superfamily phosphohydrolase/phosphomutase
MKQQAGSAPLVILGIDAGDPELIMRWASDGTLPNIGSIVRRGCFGKTAGPEMVSEHGAWVSLMSGVSRAEHGYYYFRQLKPRSYDLAPARGRELGVEPFWTRLPAEKRIAVIDVPDFAAPRPQPGLQLSEWATHYPYYPASTHPDELLDRVRREFGPQMVIHEDPASDYSADRKLYAKLMERTAKKGRLGRSLLGGEKFDLVVAVFAEAHTGSHQFWRYRPESNQPVPKEHDGELKDAIKNLYQAIDAEFGKILDRQPPNANVFVVSSVGMKSQWPAAGLSEAIPFALGYQFAPKGASSGFDPLSWLRKMLPRSVRNALSGFLSSETRENLVSDKFRKATDWSRTRLFSIPSYYTSQFRVNLAGREPEGIVEPGAEYEKTLDEFEAELRQLVDPVTKRPAMKAIRRTQDLFGGDPPEILPDLFAEWEEADHFVERVEHPKGEIVQSPCEFHRGSDHSQFGFVAAAGPAIENRGDLGEISLLDLTPTFLELLGQPAAEELPGKALNILKKKEAPTPG